MSRGSTPVAVKGLSCLSEQAGIFVGEIPEAPPLNRKLLREFLAAVDTGGVKRSHFFEGRYENLYLGLDRMPANLSRERHLSLAINIGT